MLTGPSGLQAQSLDSLRAEIRRLGSAGEFSGVVLLRKGGKTVLHEAYGLASIGYQAPNRTDTRFNLASVGKMFTAVSIGQLVEQGKLRWTDTLAKVLPDYPNRAQASRITIHQLLTHTSGMGLSGITRSRELTACAPPGLVPFSRTLSSLPAAAVPNAPGTRCWHGHREGFGRGLLRLSAEAHLRSAGMTGHKPRSGCQQGDRVLLGGQRAAQEQLTPP
jgi:CubicO group peptidase (beta-lactamase class C family)